MREGMCYRFRVEKNEWGLGIDGVGERDNESERGGY